MSTGRRAPPPALHGPGRPQPHPARALATSAGLQRSHVQVPNPVLTPSPLRALCPLRQALREAGLEKEANPEGWEKVDKKRVGVIVGSGMGGLTVFQVCLGGCL